jgi:broad specificity phosphatase PhoE
VLIVIRHGQTAANASGLLLGRGDPPLNELGRRQAEALAGIAGVAGAAAVVSSPLRRCQETAGLLRRPVQVDERWVEMDYGEYEGMPLADIPTRVWATWRADPSWAPQGGESLAAVGSRVRAACDELADMAAHSDVVVVSHVSPIKAAVAWALGVGDGVAWRMFLDVAAVCRIAVGPLGPSLRSYNETLHGPVGSQEAGT